MCEKKKKTEDNWSYWILILLTVYQNGFRKIANTFSTDTQINQVKDDKPRMSKCPEARNTKWRTKMPMKSWSEPKGFETLFYETIYYRRRLAKYQHAEEIQLCIKSNKHRKQLGQLQQDIITYNLEGLVSDHRASWALKRSRSINRNEKRINKTVTQNTIRYFCGYISCL